MNNAPDKLVIGQTDEIKHAEAKEFLLPESQHDGFVINWHGQFYAYLNSCPHTQAALNWVPQQFFDTESEFLQCSLHGALFEIDTGECLRGPCVGAFLEPIPVRVEAGEIRLALPARRSRQ